MAFRKFMSDHGLLENDGVALEASRCAAAADGLRAL